MKEPFTHDVRAVLGAPGKALSLKKIAAAAWYLLLAYILYTAVTYLALLYDGVDFDYIWQSYGLFLFRLFPFDAAIARIIHYLGIALAGICLSLAIMAPAAIMFEEVRGNVFFSVSQAIRLTFRRVSTLAAGLVALAAFVGVFYLLGMGIGAIGRIPLLGDLAIGVFYIIPVFFTLVLVTFVVFVAVVGVVLFPIIIAAQKTADLFDALLQLFSVVIREPVRFFWYFALSAGLAKISSFIFGYLFYRTFQFSHLMLVQGGGEKIERMFNTALAMLPLRSSLVTFMTQLFPGLHIGFTLPRWGYGGEATLGAVLLAISFFLLFVVVAGYMIAVLATGLARGYIVIRRIKDDYLIIDETPLEPAAEYAPPPLPADCPPADE